eukprot:TRINITY_DN2154_c0_g1_i1.p1 TRINITY_DN2154_c0_g1~~TRINITY_DN2154_c0_g1_i1.p1  ORF type:complete len:1151 (+),score=308.65 TRINITY_DN2154_c0_g1_i1:37-3489(+)
MWEGVKEKYFRSMSSSSNNQIVTISGGMSEEKKQDPFPRVFEIDVRGTGESFCHNRVTTSRYTLYNFLPMNLFEQFQEKSRMYFLFIGILQCITAISNTGGSPTIYLPLAFIVAVSATRAGIEDWRRHVNDRKECSRTYLVFDHAQGDFVKKASGDLTVGEIVKVLENEIFPADVLAIKSSHPRGHCFVETASLDGETNLKVKRAVTETHVGLKEEKDVGNRDLLSGTLSLEAPNKNFDQFKGKIELGEKDAIFLEASTLLLRDTCLKNTDWIIGMIVYTGADTKIRRNASGGSKRLKRSSVSLQLDKFMMVMFVVQIILCFFASLVQTIWTSVNGKDHWYLRHVYANTGEAVGDFFLKFFTWYIVLNALIPISLAVSLELVKSFQAVFIGRDLSMWDDRTEKPCIVQSSSLNEELGQIEYVFSDKTGTLTQNRMQFRTAFVKSRQYGSSETEISRRVQARRQANDAGAPPQIKTQWTDHVESLLKAKEAAANSASENEYVKFDVDSQNEMLRAVNESKDGDSMAELTKEYLLHMAISNTITPIIKGGDIQYQSASPDELAFCMFAKMMGYTLCGRNPTQVKYVNKLDKNVQEETWVFQHLATLDFNSKRKRLTMIYEQQGKVYVMCKGADSEMWPLFPEDERKREEETMSPKLAEMAEAGLRTLLLGSAVRDSSWWAQWKQVWEENSSLPETGEEMNHTKGGCSDKCRICGTMKRIEVDAGLYFLGATAIEDMLQDLVPECIEDFLDAGVKVWMLTGDKRETAKNIALACNLIDPDMEDYKHWENIRLIEITGYWAKLLSSKSQLRQLFAGWDLNQDGKLQMYELMAVFEILNMPIEDGLLSGIFTAFDKNKDAELEIDEFLKLMQDIQLTMSDAVRSDINAGKRLINSIDDLVATPVSMVVEGEALATLFEDDSGMTDEAKERLTKTRNDFFDLASRCKSLVCCRLTPLQKATMVREIRERTKAITLAVGDGANDEQMILTADVGVGIAGVEGSAATRASDYAIGKFRFLHDLMFVHGHWNYQRVCATSMLIFYKTVVFTLTSYVFGFWSIFSGQQLYYDYMALINSIVFTAFPVLVLGIWDQSIERMILENFPKSYRIIAKGKLCNLRLFRNWMLSAFTHALFAVPIFVYSMGDYWISRSDRSTALL